MSWQPIKHFGKGYARKMDAVVHGMCFWGKTTKKAYVVLKGRRMQNIVSGRERERGKRQVTEGERSDGGREGGERQVMEGGDGNNIEDEKQSKRKLRWRIRGKIIRV